uniref:Carboxylesterase type B domain-containing protein n=1 Tax=Panagrolaimus sp. JU765 TaxID=591449 RepID=A0AC34R4E6_9BILA
MGRWKRFSGFRLLSHRSITSDSRKTKHWGLKCLPFRRNFDNLEGYHEDCLFFNILIPSETTNKTDLLVIFSNEQLNVVRILNLMKKEVAVAVVHFRQGLQGFAALNEETGDYGISDIQIALDFIQNNLENFGIDGSVVLASENDGASSLHIAFDDWKQKNNVDREYKLILLNGHKMIHRFEPDPERTRKNTLTILKKIECDLPSDSQALDCSRTKSFTEILRAFLELDFPEEYGAVFRPVQNDAEIKSPTMAIIGIQSTLSADLYKTVDEFQTNYTYADFKTMLARVVSAKKFKNGALIRRLVFHEYVRALGDKKDTYFLWQQGRKVLFDKNFEAPTVLLLPKLKPEENQIFLFKFDVPNPISKCLDAYLPEYLTDFCDQWWKFVLRFTTKGAPTSKNCGNDKPKWPALKTAKRDYFVVMHDDGKIEWDFNFGIRSDAFWNELVPIIENLELAGKRPLPQENDIELVDPLEEEDDQQQYHTLHRDEF